MAEYCLTTWVCGGEGTVKQPGCSSPQGLGDAPCAFNFEEGSIVDILATPSYGWEMGEWVIDSFAVYSIIGNTLRLTMPSGDINICASFTHPNIDVSLSVYQYPQGDYGGCIDLISPVDTTGNVSYPCNGFVVSVPISSSQQARALAVPYAGWKIQKWKVEATNSSGTTSNTYDITSSYFDFDVDGYDSVSVMVYFEEEGECLKNNLSINIIGGGTVTPSSGEYCVGSSISLYPISLSGYVFDRWEYVGDGFSEIGSSLVVNMSSSRVVTAVFEKISGFSTNEYKTFYCSSQTDLSNVVSFEYEVDSNPSLINKYHFRIVFYRDSSKQNEFYTAYSLSDIKRWYYDDGNIREFPSNGIEIGYGDKVSVIYDPDILPHILFNEQRNYFINAYETEEIPLLCNIKYYIDIEAYNNDMAVWETVKSSTIIFPCREDEDILYRGTNRDKWLSSGQGVSDIKVSQSSEGAFFPSVSSNFFGLYQIAWQSKRGSQHNIYGGIWDSEQDVFFTSGQGYGDNIYFENAYRPIVLTDQAENFPIVSTSKDNIKFYSCPLPKGVSSSSTTEGYTEQFETYCLPSSSSSVISSIGELSVRIYEQDQRSSIVVNPNKVLPVVNSQRIRLDIDGINAIYAVRLRDSEDTEWSEWINVGAELYETKGDDVTLDAYRIDNSRIIVPWIISRFNGIRRICVQALTLYGVTTSKCIEIYLNQDIIQYAFKFYQDSSYESESPFYNGYYIVKENSNINDSNVYFEVIFNEDVNYDYSDITFNVFQQGINDLWGLSFSEKIGNRIFRGSFPIYKDDGVFNRDGKAFIQIVLPEIGVSCGEDISDNYNLTVSDNSAQEYQDLKPEEIYIEEKSNKTNKVLDIIRFKQYYNADDPNYLFGNPDYFRND